MNKILYFALTIMILISCEESTTEPVNVDTDSPVVTFSIAEGDELSGEATLYINVEDDSEIESVSVLINDITIITKTTDFDTIIVDLKYLFALDGEEPLFVNSIDNAFKVDNPDYFVVKATDIEGNIGESESKEAVITQFKGWRVYQDFRNEALSLEVDENGLIWYCSSYALFIYNSETDQLAQIPNNGGDLPLGQIVGLEIIEGSKAWIATTNHISEYDFTYNTFNSIEIPAEPNSGLIPNITSINYSNNILYIGTKLKYDIWYSRAFTYKYQNSNFSIFENEWVNDINDMECHPDGSLFISGVGGIEILDEESMSHSLTLNVPIYSLDNLVIDQNGIGWIEIPNSYAGMIRYIDEWEPFNWGVDERYYPLFVNSSGYKFAGVQISRNGYQIGAIDFIIFDNDETIYLSEYDTPFSKYTEYYYPPYTWYDYWDNNKKHVAEAPNGDIWMIVFDRLWRYRPSIGGYPTNE